MKTETNIRKELHKIKCVLWTIAYSQSWAFLLKVSRSYLCIISHRKETGNSQEEENILSTDQTNLKLCYKNTRILSLFLSFCKLSFIPLDMETSVWQKNIWIQNGWRWNQTQNWRETNSNLTVLKSTRTQGDNWNEEAK